MQTAPITSAPVKERNMGLELLRAAAMGSILLTHIITQGGVMYEAAAQVNYPAYALCSLLLAFNTWGSSVFAILSGYLYIRARYRPANFIRIWLQTVFYMLVITAVFRIATPDRMGVSSWVNCIFPVTKMCYWYITAYAGLFLLIPLLNAAVNALDRRTLTLTLLVLLAVFCILPPLGNKDTFHFSGGYSPWWLVVMYLCGAYIRLYGESLLARVKTHTIVLIMLVCGLITWGIKMLASFADLLTTKVWLANAISSRSPAFQDRNAVFLMIVSICVFLLFLRLRIPARLHGSVRFLSSHALGVYLLHTQPLLYGAAYYHFSVLETLPFPLLLPAILGIAIVIFAACIFADWLRSLLFRLLKIDALAERIGAALTKWLGRLTDRILRE